MVQNERINKHVMVQNEDFEPEEEEAPDYETKIEVLEKLIEDQEIIMLYDDMNNCYRPMWKTEWDIQIDVKSEKEAERDIEKYKPYVANVKDINSILENGSLEWFMDGHLAEWYVKIWW